MTVIGQRMRGAYWIDPSENAEDIVISTKNPFDTPMWVETMEELERRRRGKKHIWDRMFMLKGRGMATELQPLASCIREVLKKKKTVRVLDFGGGIGDNYEEFIRTNRDIAKRVFFVIVDLKTNCEKGREKYKNDKHVKFMINDDAHKSHIRKCLKANHIDIVHCCGTLQYIIPYTEELKMMVSGLPERVVFVRTPMTGRDRTFYCRQRICPNFGKYKEVYLGDILSAVISKSELTGKMKELGYTIQRENDYRIHEGYRKGIGAEFGEVFYENIIYEQGH